MARWPLLHFILIGSLLFAGQRFALEHGWLAQQRGVIRVAAADILRLRDDWMRESGRMPTERELAASLDRHVDEEVMLREAHRLGLDQRDPVVRERLLLNMRFAFPDARERPAQLLREARAMGMGGSDLVVRRRLIQLMEQRMTRPAAFTQSDLRDYVRRHPERYAARGRFAFEQVFLSGDVPRHDPQAEAGQLLMRLQRNDPGGSVAGDPFLLGSRFPLSTPEEISRIFGTGFAKAVASAQKGVWIGPLHSAYGLHLVRVNQTEMGASPDFSAVRAQAAYAMLPELEQRALRDSLSRLRQRYLIEIEGQGADLRRLSP